MHRPGPAVSFSLQTEQRLAGGTVEGLDEKPHRVSSKFVHASAGAADT